MSSASEMDIQGVITASMTEFFERILSMGVELDDGDLLAVQEGEGFVTAVEVTGDLAGRLEIKTGSEFAVLMAASMLGGNIDDVDAEYEVPDLLGEMADFLGRKLKESCSREGIACEITGTQILARDDLLESSAPLPQGARCMFRHEGHEGWVDFRLSCQEGNDTPTVDNPPGTGSEETAVRPQVSGKAADREKGSAETTVTVSGGDHEISLELEPLDASEDDESSQDFAGLSEDEENLSDLMADITDTGVEAEASPDSAVERVQKTPPESSLREPTRTGGETEGGSDDKSAADESEQDDSEALSDDEANLSGSADGPAEDQATEASGTESLLPDQSGNPAAKRFPAETPVPAGDLRQGVEKEFRLESDSTELATGSLHRLEEEEAKDEEGPTGGRRRGLVWLTAAALAAVAVGGWFFMIHRQGVVSPEPEKTAMQQEEKPAPPEGRHPAAEVDQEPSEETAAPTAETRLARKLNDTGRLREALLGKLEEVLRLKRYFQDGIQDVRSQVTVRIQNSGVRSYRQAIADQRIELDLRTIQRRLAAIDELNRPIGWLAHAAEAVDYGIRRTRIDLSMAPYTAGVDLNRLFHELEGLTKKYALTDERLLIDGQTVEARPLNVIWQEVISPVKKVTWIQGDGSGVKGTFVNWAGSAANRRIWKELCRGDFSHAAELSMISSEAAACLASDRVRDLFLGGLRELPGAAARNLVKWPGKWLVLNGLTSISPAAARQLSRWRGKRLSLNGLVELSPQAAASLAQWGGRDLEMVSLTVKDTRKAGQVLGPLKKWESGGRRLFVPPDVRKMLDRL